LGEVDIIAYHEHTLVIVEVKARSRQDAYRAIDRIDKDKMARLQKLAARFWRDHRVERKARRLWNMRIDGIGITLSRGGGVEVAEHIENIYPVGASWENAS
jgi:Holliday junction resolvase-like predicted endonuclease